MNDTQEVFELGVVAGWEAILTAVKAQPSELITQDTMIALLTAAIESREAREAA